ncbi:hypothetical protein QL285_080963 [Trifolium repens]|jgi:hypothetical protein|nr:hypothetical protein QL285_080963 [Trifolium repens]
MMRTTQKFGVVDIDRLQFALEIMKTMKPCFFFSKIDHRPLATVFALEIMRTEPKQCVCAGNHEMKRPTACIILHRVCADQQCRIATVSAPIGIVDVCWKQPHKGC